MVSSTKTILNRFVNYDFIESDDCPLSQYDSGMGWDIACFVFIIIQIRIYSSYYFLHVREDVISSFKLAAR